MESSIRRLAVVSAGYAALLSAGSFFVIGFDLFFLSGLLAGSVAAVLKSVMWGKLPLLLSGVPGRKTGLAVFTGVGVQFISGILLFAAAWFNTRFFFGLAAGLVSTVIGAFTFTEKKQ